MSEAPITQEAAREMLAAHTPGPWSAVGAVKLVGDPNSRVDQHNVWCGEVFPPGDKYRGSICGIQSADHIAGISREEAEANARLIAAAPDTLAELREARTTLSIMRGNIMTEMKRGRDYQWEGVPEILKARIDQIDAAIQRAEGRS